LGAKGKRVKVTEAMRRANRLNARRPRLASRKGTVESEALLKDALEKLRALAPRAVKALEAAMSATDAAVVVRACEAVLDRSGLPRQTQAKVAIDFPRKLVDLTLAPGDELVLETDTEPAAPHALLEHVEGNGHDEPEPVEPPVPAYGPLPAAPPEPKPKPKTAAIALQSCPRCGDVEPFGEQHGEVLRWLCTECSQTWITDMAGERIGPPRSGLVF